MKNIDGQTDVRHINLIGGLVTCNPPKTDSWREHSCDKAQHLIVYDKTSNQCCQLTLCYELRSTDGGRKGHISK